MVGSTIRDYRIDEQVGEGSAGVVYRARDLRFDRDVALKAIRTELSADLEFMQALSEAINRQAGVPHPNIAAVYSWSRVDGISFLASEWIDGQALNDSLSPEEVLRIFLDVLAAVHAAHRQGVVHGGIKPANILIDRTGRVKVTDFGIAGVLGERARKLATAAPAPPPDARSDQAALASMVLTILDGRLPEPWMLPVFQRATSTDPAQRFADLDEFARALRFEPKPVMVAAPPPVEPKGATPVDENVAFTVFRPRSIAPAAWETMLVFAHLTERRPDETSQPEPVEEVHRQASLILGDRAPQFQDLTQDSSLPISLEGQLTFVPEVAGVDFNPPNASILWQEQVHRVEFRLRAQASLDGTTARGRLSVFLGRLVVAQIPLAIRVAREAAPGPGEKWEPVTHPTYRRIFASYSHKDVSVVEEFERYAAATGDRYLRDVIQLRSGEEWRKSLLDMIRQADVFQLFWSSNAMVSQYVEEEWRYALSLRRDGFVRPVYWENPMPEEPERGLPPDELRLLHFQRVSPGLQRVQASSGPGTGSAGDRHINWNPTPRFKMAEAPQVSRHETAVPPPLYRSAEAPPLSQPSYAPPRTASTIRWVYILVGILAAIALLTLFLLHK